MGNKILGRLDDSRWCALTECAVWKDGVLKLCESSGRCECTLCAGGLVCVFVHLMVYLNPPSLPPGSTLHHW